jgi:hypothetical protein
MNLKLLIVFEVIAALLLSVGTARAQEESGVRALNDIVGTWQSDTVNGTSALSRCEWTPARLAVLCEQEIHARNGLRHVENLFTYDPQSSRYFFYGLPQPGDSMAPISLEIKNHVWVYGGQAAGSDGVTRRTVNEFSAADEYVWRRESSADGRSWTIVSRGRARRVRER